MGALLPAPASDRAQDLTPVEARWRPPKHFDGYQLVNQLGAGAMGEVHLARDTLLDRLVAIKFISTADPDEASRRRFLVEARAVARLEQHPNVVPVHRVGEVDGRPYLVSAFVRGKPLDTVPLPMAADTIQHIALDLASGLAAAHHQGVVHRDLKPANVMLEDNGRAQLLDFGIAKLNDRDPTPLSLMPSERARPLTSTSNSAAVLATLDPSNDAALLVTLDPSENLQPIIPALDQTLTQALDQTLSQALAQTQSPPGMALTQPGAVLGTPLYMAPESWRGEPATFATDVYAFGAMIYHVATGYPPFEGDSFPALADAVLNQDFVPLGRAASRVDPAFARVIDRCLQRRPEGRFRSGQTLRAALGLLDVNRTKGDLPPGNPYRGLDAFEAEHRALFFGRDGETRQVLDRLMVKPFVLVVGDSGSGKSSLCRAGVLPRLQDWLQDGRQWQSVVLVPDRQPINALCAVLSGVLGQPEDSLQARIEADPCDFARWLRGQMGTDKGLTLFIDQLEELETIADPAQSKLMGATLSWLATRAPGIRLLATARGDFIARLAQMPHLGDTIGRALFFLRPLSAERIREVIEGPAAAKGVVFADPSCVDGLVDTTLKAGAGVLPLLQFALTELWALRDRKNNSIPATALEEIGGVAGALSRHADAVIDRMSGPQKAAARAALVALVSTEGTRARRPRAELSPGPQTGSALKALVQSRLIVARDADYEITHEALIKAWPTLVDWLSGDADTRRLHARLNASAAEWSRLNQSTESLWRGRQLHEARNVELAAISTDAAAFLTDSRRFSRKRLQKRWALRLAAPLIAIIAFTAARLMATQQQNQQLAVLTTTAIKALNNGRQKMATALGIREQALAAFDHGANDAEPLWTQWQAAATTARPRLAEAARSLEAALKLDGARPQTRGLLADTLLTRATLASLSQADTTELLARMDLYDTNGQRRAQWQQRAMLQLKLSPADTTATIHQVQREGDRLVEGPATPFEADGTRLTPGSYVVDLSATDHQSIRLTVAPRRGETLSLSVELPPKNAVPSGFVFVPAGRALIGSAAADSLRKDFFRTVPRHPVYTGAYLIGREEVSFGEWIQWLETLDAKALEARSPRLGGSGFQGGLSLKRLPSGKWRLRIKPGEVALEATGDAMLKHPGRPAQRWQELPVVGITAGDAKAFAAWLDHTGRLAGARLCSDNEWERAARGSDGRAYPASERIEKDDANHELTWGKDAKLMGPEVGGSRPKSRSPYGVDDMAGNVWEWVQGRDGVVARGGSYNFGPNSSRIAGRELIQPGFRDTSVGFRLCAHSSWD